MIKVSEDFERKKSAYYVDLSSVYLGDFEFVIRLKREEERCNHTCRHKLVLVGTVSRYICPENLCLYGQDLLVSGAVSK